MRYDCVCHKGEMVTKLSHLHLHCLICEGEINVKRAHIMNMKVVLSSSIHEVMLTGQSVAV